MVGLGLKFFCNSIKKKAFINYLFKNVLNFYVRNNVGSLLEFNLNEVSNFSFQQLIF